MTGQNERYDEALLDEAPSATTKQRQEGYDVDILDPPTRAPSAQPIQQSLHLTPQSTDVENNLEDTRTAKSPPRSFWKSRNGIITLSVITLVILGAVIGGAVGGTVGKHASTNVAHTTTSRSTSSASAQSSQSSSTMSMMGGATQASAAVGADNSGPTSSTASPTSK